MSLYDEAQSKIESFGYYPGPLRFDGRIHRFKIGNKDTKESGWYIGYDAKERLFLVFSDWRSKRDPHKFVFQAGGLQDKTSMERARKQLEDLEGRAKRQQSFRQETASIESEKIWSEALMSDFHPYLRKKNLKKSYGARVWRDLLLIPVMDSSGKIWGIQKISKEGKKLFHPGTKKRGCYFLIGEEQIKDRLYVCEGFATGASIFQTNNIPVAISFDAGNMRLVATELQKKYKNVTIVIAADNDEVGMAKGEKAAEAVNGPIVVPRFKEPEEKLTDFNDLLSKEGEEKVKEQIEAVQITHSNSEFEDWFYQWFKDHNVSVGYHGRYQFEGRTVDYLFLRAKMLLDMRKRFKKYSYTEIDAALFVHLQLFRESYVEEIKKKICGYDPECKYDLAAFVTAITGKADRNEVLVMKHFIWQIKRKMMDLPVEHHMMPVLSGLSGSGKSVAIRKMLEPLKELVIEKQLDAVSDDRQYNVFGDYYVIFFDEMAKAEKTDLDALKKVITASELSARPLYTNKQCVFPNRSTMIGTTNHSLDMILKDYTSARRWYQIKSDDHCHWERINSLDYVRVWQAVNPHETCPVISILDDIKDSQEDQRYKNSVEEFILEREIKPSREFKVSTEVLYKEYFDWSKSGGIHPVDKIYFAKQLSFLKFERTQCGTETKRLRAFFCFAPGIKMEPVMDGFEDIPTTFQK